jgi:hypothetical protein
MVAAVSLAKVESRHIFASDAAALSVTEVSEKTSMYVKNAA